MADDKEQPRTSRFDYVEFSKEAMMLNDDMTQFAKTMERVLDDMPKGREVSLALTHLEETMMWFRKALRYVK